MVIQVWVKSSGDNLREKEEQKRKIENLEREWRKYYEGKSPKII